MSPNNELKKSEKPPPIPSKDEKPCAPPALLKLKLDAIVAVGITDAGITDFSLGMLTVIDDVLDYEENQHLTYEEISKIHILNPVPKTLHIFIDVSIFLFFCSKYLCVISLLDHFFCKM